MERWFNTGKKILCVGRNYAAHAKELNNPVPKKPFFFLKPCAAQHRAACTRHERGLIATCRSTCYLQPGNPIVLPRGLGEIHHEGVPASSDRVTAGAV